ncbi:DUF2330 domain-containing protein [bacterium]|nr:DUF2330 domain-containing protein [bacterium]
MITFFLFADGGFLSKSPLYLEAEDQTALIYFSNNRETLILSTSYTGKAADFSWLIPTPSKPKVSKPPKNILKEVEKLYTTIEEARRMAQIKSSIPVMGGPEMMTKVLERKKLGYYDIAVLSSPSPDELYKWCQKEGYKLPALSPSIIKPYTDKGWYFVAVKLDLKVFGREKVEGELEPIRLDFSSEKIVFPALLTKLNRYQIDPKLENYDLWWKKEVSIPTFSISSYALDPEISRIPFVEAVAKQTRKDIIERKPFEKSLLYRLGHNDLATKLGYEEVLRGNLELEEFIKRISFDIQFNLVDSSQKERFYATIYILSPYRVAFDDTKAGNGEDELFAVPHIYEVSPHQIKTHLTDEKGKPLFNPKGNMFLTKYDIFAKLSTIKDDFYFLKSNEMEASAFSSTWEIETGQRKRTMLEFTMERYFKPFFSALNNVLWFVYLSILAFLVNPFVILFFIFSIAYKKHPSFTINASRLTSQFLAFLWFLVSAIILFLINFYNADVELEKINPVAYLWNTRGYPLYVLSSFLVIYAGILVFALLNKKEAKKG